MARLVQLIVRYFKITMFYKRSELIFLLLLLVYSPLSLNAETSQRDEILDSHKLALPKYFYLKCRDSPAMIRNPREIDLGNVKVIHSLAACTAYVDASLSWFLFSLKQTLNKGGFNCYFNSTLVRVPTVDEVLTSIISFLNMNQAYLDTPGIYTPDVFFKAMLSKYPIPNECIKQKQITLKKN